MIHDHIAHVIYGEYTPALEDSLKRYRDIARKQGMLKQQQSEGLTRDEAYIYATYSPINLKEKILTQEAFERIEGGRPKKMNKFLEEGIFNLRDVKNNSCVFCDYNPKENILQEEKEMYENLIPQFSTYTVEYPVSVCEACLINIYFAVESFAGNASIDSCKLCKTFYMVEPDEYERRMELKSGEGRGMHTCDACLIDMGFGNTPYLKKKTCLSCTKDEEYDISLTEMEEYSYICDTCKSEDKDGQFNDRSDDYPVDEEDETKQRRLIEEQVRAARMNGSSKFAYSKMDLKPLGHGYGQPENMYIQMFEIPTLREKKRCISYNLVEIDPEKLSAIGGEVKAISLDMITHYVMRFDEMQVNPIMSHDEYFTFSIQGFLSLKKNAHQVGIAYLKKMNNDLPF